MNSRLMMENIPQHLCVTCKFISKCRRARVVYQQLTDIEADALDNWKMDLDVTYMIRECDLYSVNWDLVHALQSGEIEFVDDEESEGED